MTDGTGFLVEDFIQSITAQLDRVQDVLRLKAQTRPLTYALKDFSLDLNVFVDMDGEGNVRFRTSSPNESGASVVRLGFTTITKPMIEENTVSMSMTTSPTLDELGLEREEQRRLGQLGVRNAAQLQQLRQSAGTTTIARYTGVPIDRLRTALRLGQPFVRDVQPEEPRPPIGEPRPPISEPQRPASERPPATRPRPTRPPGERPPLVGRPPLVERPPSVELPPTRRPSRPKPAITVRPEPAAPPVARADLPVLRVAPDTRRLRISGGNLLNPSGPPVARLAGQPLPVEVLDDDEMVVELPPEHSGGALEIALPHGETVAFALSLDPLSSLVEAGAMDATGAEWEPGETSPHDPWSPQAGGPV